MTQVWDADKESLRDVSESDAKELSALGVPTGPEAELTAREHGWEGKLGAGLTAFGNAAGLGIPKLLMREFSPGRATEVDRAQEANPHTTTAANIAGGIVPFAAAEPLGAAGRIAMSAYAGGTSALDDEIRNGDWQKAVQSGDYTAVAEKFIQGVGIGGALGSAVEGGAHVLGKLATSAQKAIGNTLTRWSKSGTFERVADMNAISNRFSVASQDLGMAAQKVQQTGEEYLQSLAATRAPNAVPRPYAGLTEKPPPLPQIPFAQAEAVPEGNTLAAENIGRARAQGNYDNAQAARLNAPKMTQDEAISHWYDLDRQAEQAAKSAPRDSDIDMAEEFRRQRDAIAMRGEGNHPDTADVLKRFPQEAMQPSPLHALTPEIDSAFDRAGFNQAPDAYAQLSPEPKLTDVPKQSAHVPTDELPAPRVKLPNVSEPPPLKTPGLAAAEGVTPAIKPLRTAKLPALPRKFAAQEATPLAEDALPFGQAKYAFKPGKEKSLGAIGRDVGIAGLGVAAHSVNPFLGYLLGGHAAYRALRGAADELGMLAQRAAINHFDATNIMASRVLGVPLKASAKALKTLLQSSGAQISASYLSGDTDKDYQEIVKAVTSAQANPNALMEYRQQRYGALSNDPRFIGALAAQDKKGVDYIAQAIPKQTRPPGLLDAAQPYDPPHSLKLKLIQRYNGVNDPHGVLAAPSYEGVAAVQAVHPQTLAEFRQALGKELLDEKRRAALSPAQLRDISIVMGTPTDWLNSPAGIAALASVGTQGGQAPTGGAPQGQSKPSNSGVNLGGLSESYATMVAPPSEQNALEDVK